MTSENLHAPYVELWIVRTAMGLPSGQVLLLFDRAFAALWQRACLTLGSVTLTAIVERVLHDAKRTFPLLSPLAVEAGGISTAALAEHAAALDRAELIEAVLFTLVEFLVVLGKLTAEILTPALHAELSKVAGTDAAPDEEARS